MHHPLFLLLLAFTNFTLADVTPILSAAGKQRLLENLSLLDKNLKEVKNNLVNCKKNAGTVEAEIRELNQLENEHAQLKLKYKNQLEAALKEMDKNESALRELSAYQKDVANSTKPEALANGNQKEDLERSQAETLERERWKAEAKAKGARLENLIQSLNQNLNTIESKKAPLKEQYHHWLAKEKEYQKLYSELMTRKSETEKTLKTQN